MSLTKASYSMINGAPANVLDFGADSTGVADSTAAFAAAFAASKNVVIPGEAGEIYRISLYPNVSNMVVTGLGKPQINLFYSATPVFVRFGDNSVHENIFFNCTVSDLDGSRASLENASNTTIRNCGFVGFRNPTNGNGWGLYAKLTSNCVIDKCYFGNNTQSDIALVDDVESITIINAYNETDVNGVYLNVEPNAPNSGITGLNVIGGSYRSVTLLDNTSNRFPNRNIVFSGCVIASLFYNGSMATFNNCRIESLGSGTTDVISGQLNIDNFGVSENLVTDQNLFSVDSADATAYWGTTTSGTGTVTRAFTNDSPILVFNSTNTTSSVVIFSRNYISVAFGTLYAFCIRTKTDNSTYLTGNHAVNALISWYNASNTLLSSTNIKCARAEIGADSGIQTSVTFLTVPANAVSCKLFIGKNETTYTSTIYVSSVGLFSVNNSLNQPNFGNWNTTIAQTTSPVTQKNYYFTKAPTQLAHVVNERSINSVPTVGQPKSWVCTVAGTPGTWVSEGNL